MIIQSRDLFLRRQERKGATRARALDMLGPTILVIAVYYQERFCFLLLPEFAAILLEVAEPARANRLEKMYQLNRELYHLLKNPLILRRVFLFFSPRSASANLPTLPAV